MFDIKYYTIPISNPLLVIIGKETSFYEKFGTYWTYLRQNKFHKTEIGVPRFLQSSGL